MTSENEEAIKAVDSLHDFILQVEKDHGIKLIFSEVMAKMLIKKHNPQFVEWMVSAIIKKWHSQNFDTVQEGLRGLNAMLYGVEVALQLDEPSTTLIEPNGRIE